MDIHLTFINNSDDVNNSDIVIFQKNVAVNFEEPAVAWKVIKNCGRNWTHPFTYPMDFEVAAQDSWGNVSNLQPGQNGQRWMVVRSTSGDVLSLDSNPASSMNEVEIQNSLTQGSINAQIYKDGKLLATKTGLAPQQKGVFEFKPTIWVGVVSELEEGDVMNSAVLDDINTEISLFGITKANIIMTGGGTGPDARPYTFTLEPIA